MKLVNDGRHDIEDLCLAGVWDVAVVVQEHGFKKCRNHALVHHFEVVSLLHICVDELQNFLFDSP